MKEEILKTNGQVADELIEKLTNELMDDPDYADSIRKVGAKTLATMMFVGEVDVEGFSIESTVVTGNGTEFTIEVGKV